MQENGIFDALRKNVLSAVQFTIILDKEEPENVLETYTFTFKYTGGHGDVNSRLESLSINPVGCVADVKTAQTARVGLEMIVRRLITLSAFMPTLPSMFNPEWSINILTIKQINGIWVSISSIQRIVRQNTSRLDSLER